jgi:hypothetical protein
MTGTTLPAVVRIVDLPTGTTLTGVELFEVVQTTNGVGLSIQVLMSQISALVFAKGTVTLTANAITTVVTDAAVSVSSNISMSPITAHAGNDGATTSWVAGSGSFTITHANNARTDRTFAYTVFK